MITLTRRGDSNGPGPRIYPDPGRTSSMFLRIPAEPRSEKPRIDPTKVSTRLGRIFPLQKQLYNTFVAIRCDETYLDDRGWWNGRLTAIAK